MAELIAVPYKNGKVLLKIPEIKDLQNIDIEKITRIQYDKIGAELLTFPVLLNRLGLILAEAESHVSLAELNLKIGKADLSKQAKQSLYENDEKTTEANVMDWIRRTKKYRELNEIHIEAVRKKSIVNSAYWSAKDKSDKLNKISDKLTADELMIDSMVDAINGIQIVVKENTIK